MSVFAVNPDAIILGQILKTTGIKQQLNYGNSLQKLVKINWQSPEDKAVESDKDGMTREGCRQIDFRITTNNYNHMILLYMHNLR